MSIPQILYALSVLSFTLEFANFKKVATNIKQTMFQDSGLKKEIIGN